MNDNFWVIFFTKTIFFTMKNQKVQRHWNQYTLRSVIFINSLIGDMKSFNNLARNLGFYDLYSSSFFTKKIPYIQRYLFLCTAFQLNLFQVFSSQTNQKSIFLNISTPNNQKLNSSYSLCRSFSSLLSPWLWVPQLNSTIWTSSASSESMKSSRLLLNPVANPPKTDLTPLASSQEMESSVPKLALPESTEAAPNREAGRELVSEMCMETEDAKLSTLFLHLLS